MKFKEELLNHPSLVKYHELFDGVQYFFSTNDGVSFSVISHSASYGGKQGLYEIAPIVLEDDEFEILGEPAGNLTVKEVIGILEGNRL